MKRVETGEKSRPWGLVVLGAGVLIGCLVLGLKILETFFIYSFQASATEGMREQHQQFLYSVARKGQLLTSCAFLACQLVGGVVLRMTIVGGSAARQDWFAGSLRYSAVFAAATAACVVLFLVTR
jgi:hypothetical protein